MYYVFLREHSNAANGRYWLMSCDVLFWHNLVTCTISSPSQHTPGVLVGNFELKSIWAWPKLFLIPKRDHVKTRATLNETFTAKYDGVLPRTSLWTGSLFGEKRPKSEIYTSKRDDELPHPFHMQSPPPPPGQHMFLSRTIAAIDQAGKCCLNEPQCSIIGVVYLVSETEHL